MSLGLIGECCGPCFGEPPDINGDDWVYPKSGLIANEAEGKFTIVIGRFPPYNPLGGPPPPSYGVDPITIGYSVTYYNECGCPHMIGRVSGTLSWAGGDTSDKVVEIPLLAHGPPMFWTCAGVPPGGESASFDLAYISPNVWLPNGGHYDIVAVCNHAAQNANGQSFVASPTFSYHRGVAHVNRGFKHLATQVQGYGKYTEKAYEVGGAEQDYEREITCTDMIMPTASRRQRGSYAFTWPGAILTTNTETVREWTDEAGRKFRITLSNPLRIGAEAVAEENMNLARPLVGTPTYPGGGFATSGKVTVDGGEDNTPTPPWDTSMVWTPPEALACPFEFVQPAEIDFQIVGPGWGLGSWSPPNWVWVRACRYVPSIYDPITEPPPPPDATRNVAVMVAVKADARGCLLNSSQPVRIELHVTTHQFTNPEQTAWIDESNTGWFDITDTEHWVEPPPFFGFKTVAWRIVPPTPPPLPYYCHPGYVP